MTGLAHKLPGHYGLMEFFYTLWAACLLNERGSGKRCLGIQVYFML